MGKVIAKVLCPCCKGEKTSPELGWPCLWCRFNGESVGRVRVETAARYADQLWMIAGGGYIDGTHSLADMRQMEAEAAGVYQKLGRALPWK